MSNIRRILTFAALVTCLPVADVTDGAMLLKKSGERIFGFVVHQSDTSVKLRVRKADGTWEEKSFFRTDIVDIYPTVKTSRLIELKPDNPKSYRDYAEELAEKKVDPEAREMAIRLYHIAAYHDPDALGESCLLGMAHLGRSAAEQRKFLAMAYLLDSDHDARRLKTPAPAVDVKPKKTPTIRKADYKALLMVLRAIRSGAPNRKKTALNTLKRNKGLIQLYAPYESTIAFDDLQAECGTDRTCPNCVGGVGLCTTCKGSGRSSSGRSVCYRCNGRKRLPCTVCYGLEVVSSMPPEKLAQVLRVELKLMAITEERDEKTDEPDVVQAEAKPVARLRTWSEIAEVEGATPSPIPALSLLHVTEFDPRESKYGDGKWIVPTDE